MVSEQIYESLDDVPACTRRRRWYHKLLGLSPHCGCSLSDEYSYRVVRAKGHGRYQRVTARFRQRTCCHCGRRWWSQMKYEI